MNPVFQPARELVVMIENDVFVAAALSVVHFQLLPHHKCVAAAAVVVVDAPQLHLTGGEIVLLCPKQVAVSVVAVAAVAGGVASRCLVLVVACCCLLSCWLVYLYQ